MTWSLGTVAGARPWTQVGPPPAQPGGGHGRVLDVRRWIVAPGGRRHVAGRRLRVGRLLIAGVLVRPGENAAPTLARSGRRAGWSAPRVRQMLQLLRLGWLIPVFEGMRRVRSASNWDAAAVAASGSGSGSGWRRRCLAATVASAASGSSGTRASDAVRRSAAARKLDGWLVRSSDSADRSKAGTAAAPVAAAGAGAPTGQAAARSAI